MEVGLNLDNLRTHIRILEQEQHEIRILLSCWEQSPEGIGQIPESLCQINCLHDLEARTRDRIRMLEEIIDRFSRLKSENQGNILDARDVLNSGK